MNKMNLREKELLTAQDEAVAAVKKALLVFNKAIVDYIPDNNLVNSDISQLLNRISNTSISFEQELLRAGDRIDRALRPEQPLQADMVVNGPMAGGPQ